MKQAVYFNSVNTFLSAKKCQKQVFVSYNLPTGTDMMTLSLVEKKIVEEMNANPERF